MGHRCALSTGVALVGLLLVPLVTAAQDAGREAGDSPDASQPAIELPEIDLEAARAISYTQDVVPILRVHCMGCHNEEQYEGGLAMETYALLVEGGNLGPVVLPGQADESRLIGVLVGTEEPRMPQGEGRPLTADEIQVLRQWIAAGAIDDTSSASSPPYEGGAGGRSAAPIYAAPPAISSLAFSPDGRALAAACRSEVVVVRLDGSSAPWRLRGEADLLNYVEFTPDGQTIVAAGGSPAAFGEVQFWDAAAGALRGARRIGRDTLFRGAVSSDGTRIALAGADGAIYVMPPDPAAEPARYEHHSDWVLALAFAGAENNLLVSGGRDKAVKVIDAATGELLRTIANPDGAVMAVGAAGTVALAGGTDRTPAAYDLNLALGELVFMGSGNEVQLGVPNADYTRALEAQPGDILAMAVDRAGQRVAVAGRGPEVRVYNVADGARTATLGGHPGSVFGVAFAPDGSLVATGGADGRLRLFDAATGELRETIVPVPVRQARP